LPAGRWHQVALDHDLQGDGGARQGEPQPGDKRSLPGNSEGHGDQRQCQRAAQHLGIAPAEDRPAQAPQALGLELQTDQEQHQHDTEFGEMQDVLDIADQAQAEQADSREPQSRRH